jgi:hypothetical protein
MNEFQMKRRQERVCGTKKKYLDKKEAFKAANTMETRIGHPMRTYQCEFCMFWHIARDKELES